MDAEALSQLHTHTHIHTHTHTYIHTHTHTHFQVQGLEKGVSENEAPGPIGAYTTTHNDTITLMPNLIHRISFTEPNTHTHTHCRIQCLEKGVHYLRK